MSSNGPLTTGQAAEHCHVSQATIVNWIKAGKLPGYTTPGGHYRILRSELLSFLRKHDMPVDVALNRSTEPRLFLLSGNPMVRNLVKSIGQRSGCEVRLTDCDYAIVAEAARSKPTAVIIDAKTSSNPSALCRWLDETLEDVTLLIVGDSDDDAEQAARAETCLPTDGLRNLEATLEELLR